MASTSDTEEDSERERPVRPGELQRSLPTRWTVGGVSVAHCSCGRLRRCEVAGCRRRRQLAVGCVGRVRGLRALHAESRDRGLSRPDHEPRRRSVASGSTAVLGSDLGRNDPEVYAAGRHGVSRVDRCPAGGQSPAPPSRPRSSPPEVGLGSLHAFAWPTGLSRPEHPGRVRQQQVRRELARVSDRRQRVRLQRPAGPRPTGGRSGRG